MGKKPLLSATKLKEFARVASNRLRPARFAKPSPSAEACQPSSSGRKMEGSEPRVHRIPLSEVVSDCVNRWFQDTLKEARAGDTAMQVLVGQMYYSGYGVPRNVQKGKAWIAKAAHTRASVWKVSDKHPGYNASDSDSDKVKSDVKK